jgi:hypothetical protein
MKKYLLTSEIWSGEVEIRFTETGVLSGIDFERSEVSEAQQMAILQRMPLLEEGLDKFTQGTRATIRETAEHIDFDMFWTRYFAGRKKDNSSKKKSRIRWNRLSRAQQQAAYAYIGKYFANIPAGTLPKLAETYLNSEVWEE